MLRIAVSSVTCCFNRWMYSYSINLLRRRLGYINGLDVLRDPGNGGKFLEITATPPRRAPVKEDETSRSPGRPVPWTATNYTLRSRRWVLPGKGPHVRNRFVIPSARKPRSSLVLLTLPKPEARWYQFLLIMTLAISKALEDHLLLPIRQAPWSRNICCSSSINTLQFLPIFHLSLCSGNSISATRLSATLIKLPRSGLVSTGRKTPSERTF